MAGKMKSIYLRKDGRYEGRYIKTIDVNGKKVYGSVYAKSFEEAEEKIKTLNDKFNMMLPSLEKTVQEAVEEYLLVKSQKIKENSFNKYTNLAENHIYPMLGNIQLRSITDDDINQFKNNKLNPSGSSSNALSIGTVNDILSILKMTFNYISKKYELKLPTIDLIERDVQKYTTLTSNDQKKLIDFLTQEIDQYKLAILIAFYTGMKTAEISALQWNDINKNGIRVNKILHRVKSSNGVSKIVIDKHISSASIRTIPILPQLEPYLDIFRVDIGYVLQSAKVAYVEPRLLQVHLNKIANQLQIKNLNFNTLRHTFAVCCIEAGTDIITLSKVLGHQDVNTTLARYGDVYEKRKKMILKFKD